MSQTLLDRPPARDGCAAECGRKFADARQTPLPKRRKLIIIVGAGFAGVAAARALRHCDAEVGPI